MDETNPDLSSHTGDSRVQDSDSQLSGVSVTSFNSFDGARQRGDSLWSRYNTEGATDPVVLDDAIQATRTAVDLYSEAADPELLSDLGIRLYTRLRLRLDHNDLDNLISIFQQAVDLTPDGDSSQPRRVSRLGASLIERFHHLGKSADLDGAITAFCCAAELVSEDDADLPGHLSNYGSSLLERFERFSEIEDLELALQAQLRAVELAPDGREDAPMKYNNLGNAFLMRFDRLGEIEDLARGIEAHRHASDITADSRPDKPDKLMNLGNSLLTRFGRTGQLEDLAQAVSAHSRAVELAIDGHPNKSMWLSSLGNSLLIRFRRTGHPDALEKAISAHSMAVELCPDGHPDKPTWFNNLGCSLFEHFGLTEKLDSLDRAISAHRLSFELTPKEHYEKDTRLHSLGTASLARFQRLGVLDDLQLAITAHYYTTTALPERDPKKPGWLSSLGDSFFMRFHRTGEIEYLEQAILAHRHAVELMPDDHPRNPSLFESLGIALLRRFERLGRLEDLSDSISLRRRAVELTPDGDPNMSTRLGDLADSVLTRFERTGELDLLEQAVSTYRRAVESTPDGHPTKPPKLDGLGRSLEVRYRRTGESEDLDNSVSLHRLAVELTPDDHPVKPLWIDHLAGALSTRFGRSKQPEDLEGAIGAYRSAIELTPDGDAWKPMRMGDLCGGLCMRYEHYGDLDDLENAIPLGHRSIDLIPDGHPELAAKYNTLATCYQRRFERLGRPEDLASAVLMFQKAIKLTPDGHPNLCMWFANLSVVLERLFAHSQTETNFENTARSFMSSIMQSLAAPSIRLLSAKRYVTMLSSYPAFSSTESLLSAHSHIISILPEIVWLGHDIHRRFDESAKLGELVNAAVSAAITAGSLENAVEWLEAGRALIWSQVLSLRTPLDELQEREPKLASSLRLIQQQLQQSSHSSFSSDSDVFGGIAGVASSTAADAHRLLVIEYDTLLRDIRGCAGFKDFLRPKKLQALLPPAELMDGPIVFINVHPSRCDALILPPDGTITSVPLPDLSYQRAVELRRLWLNDAMGGRARARGLGSIGDVEGELNPLKFYLGHMWNWIVSPVLQNIDLADLVHDDRLPHITWCPTGPLMQLPLHAAGLYDEPDGPRIYDFVVSSYIPSLTALLRSVSRTEEPRSTREVLIVTQPATPNHMPLPGTVYEGSRLKSALDESGITSKWLDDEAATIQGVRTILDQYPWVHLACHGLQNRQDATQSAFELFDGPLTLSDLMGTAAGNAELAFLSACQTAVGDENTPEESAHLAAGMLAVGFKGVIATMWSIQDADAPVVVDAFYKELLALRSAGTFKRGSTGAAYALHEATRVLREELGENRFLRWAPFVHFGV